MKNVSEGSLKRTLLAAGLFVSLSLNVVFSVMLFGPMKSDSTRLEIGKRSSDSDENFQDFETVAFAREFSERFASFESESFRSTQTALSFLLDEAARETRLNEIERISEKLLKKPVTQRGRLLRLARKSETEDSFQADLMVDLIEGTGATPLKSRFGLKLKFQVSKVDRTAQNPWGLIVKNLEQFVLPETLHGNQQVTKVGAPATAHSILLSPNSSVLLRFPCVIENVELPKGTPIRVRLTTLDVSELQMRTLEPLLTEHKMRAVCRDRAFRVSLFSAAQPASLAEEYPYTSLQSFSIAQSEPAKPAVAVRKKTKSSVEKSIEEQLGFVIEAESE